MRRDMQETQIFIHFEKKKQLLSSGNSEQFTGPLNKTVAFDSEIGEKMTHHF